MLFGCTLVVGDNNTVNVENSLVVGPGGIEDGSADPGANSVSGAGVFFREATVSSTSYHEFTFNMRNIGSVALDSMTISWRTEYLDGTVGLGDCNADRAPSCSRPRVASS